MHDFLFLSVFACCTLYFSTAHVFILCILSFSGKRSFKLLCCDNNIINKTLMCFNKIEINISLIFFFLILVEGVRFLVCFFHLEVFPKIQPFHFIFLFYSTFLFNFNFHPTNEKGVFCFSFQSKHSFGLDLT